MQRHDDKITQLLQQRAEQSATAAMYELGLRLLFAYGSVDVFDNQTRTKILMESTDWFRKAAEKGHGKSQLALGEAYFHGMGVTEDKEKAVKWFHKSAEQGDFIAKWWLGECYTNGDGVEKDLVKADWWFCESGK